MTRKLHLPGCARTTGEVFLNTAVVLRKAKNTRMKTDFKLLQQKWWKKDKEKFLIRKMKVLGRASSTALGLDDVVVEALTFQSRPDWVVFTSLDSNSSLGSNKKSGVPFFMVNFDT